MADKVIESQTTFAEPPAVDETVGVVDNLKHAVDQLSEADFAQLYRYMRRRKYPKPGSLTHLPAEERIRLLDEGFAKMREGPTEAELKAFSEAVRGKPTEESETG